MMGCRGVGCRSRGQRGSRMEERRRRRRQRRGGGWRQPARRRLPLPLPCCRIVKVPASGRAGDVQLRATKLSSRALFFPGPEAKRPPKPGRCLPAKPTSTFLTPCPLASGGSCSRTRSASTAAPAAGAAAGPRRAPLLPPPPRVPSLLLLSTLLLLLLLPLPLLQPAAGWRALLQRRCRLQGQGMRKGRRPPRPTCPQLGCYKWLEILQVKGAWWRVGWQVLALLGVLSSQEAAEIKVAEQR